MAAAASAPASPAGLGRGTAPLRPVPQSPRVYRLEPLSLQGPAAAMDQMSAGVHRDAALHDRDHRKVTQRASDRLAVAAARHRAVLDKLQAEQEKRRAVLQLETSKAEAALAQEVSATESKLTSAQVATQAHVEDQAAHDAARRQHIQQHAEVRAEVDRRGEQATRELQDVVERADRAIAASREETAARLAALNGQRLELARQLEEDLQRRSDAQVRFLEEVRSQEVQRSEKTQHYKKGAWMLCDHFAATAEAGKSVAQRNADLSRVKAAYQVADLQRQAHETQVNVEAAVKDHLAGSAAELFAAREHCAQLREDMSRESAEYAQKIRELEEHYKAHCKGIEAEKEELERGRLDGFKNTCQAVQDAEQRFQHRRTACEEELDGIDKRLREIEAETQRRAQMIMAQWTQGNAAAEADVRRLEDEAEAALRNLQASAEQGTTDTKTKNVSLRDVGIETMTELGRKCIEVQQSTQPSFEAAREAHERAAAAALRAAAELHAEPARLAAEADAACEAAQLAAAEEERVSEAFSKQRQEAAKAFARAAHREETRLKAETSEAWARVRKACFQLRLAGLHDFAAGIVGGTFDLPLPGGG